MTSFKTYRDRNTGVVRDYPVTLASRFPQLVEVEPDAKPLAYTPIPQSAIVGYREALEAADAVNDAEEADAEDTATEDED